MYSIYDLDLDTTREEINESLKLFEEQEEIIKNENIKRSREADDDGWIAVKSTKKTKRKDIGLKEDDSRRSRSKKKRKTSNDDSNDIDGIGTFYRHQLKDRKESQLIELRRKFDEDREKIRLLKQQHNQKFQPS